MNRRAKHPCGATHSPHLTARLFSCYAQAETRTLCTPMTTSPVNKLTLPNLVPSRDLPAFISSEKTNPSQLVRYLGEKSDFCSERQTCAGEGFADSRQSPSPTGRACQRLPGRRASAAVCHRVFRQEVIPTEAVKIAGS